jgi:4-hydroxybenzoate polyprenyltransferase
MIFPYDALKLDSQNGPQQLPGMNCSGLWRYSDEKSAPLMLYTLTEKVATKTVTLDEQTLPDTRNDRVKNWSRTFSYHLQTLWLFTQSDLKSMIYPNIIFSLACQLSRTDLAPGHNRNLINIFSQIPYVFVWLWFNLLLFNLANQRLPLSIKEDSINKPWRPIPSGRIDATRARVLIFVMMSVVLLVSLALGAATPALALMALTWAYNDLGGADDSFIIRNVLNALGMSVYSSGAIIIGSGSRSGLTLTATHWVAFIGLVVATTVHVQDMSDQKGDAVNKRKTLPLVIGDGFARWIIAGAVVGWSLAAPTFWKLGVAGYTPTATVGMIIAFRILWLRHVSADKTTWTYWCIWMVSLYLLPLWL